MKSIKKGKLLKIYISECQKHKSKPLFHTIVERAKKANILGITVCRGIEGLSIDNTIHMSHVLTLSDDLPITIEIFDTEEKIDNFHNKLNELISEGFVVIQRDVEIVKYTKQ